MRTHHSHSLAQSPYFTPAFNSAIFDGPLRIYFAQVHESLALKIYFALQLELGDCVESLKEYHRLNKRCLMLMLYPSEESFHFVFPEVKARVVAEEFQTDQVIAVSLPMNDVQVDDLVQQAVEVLQQLLEAEDQELAGGFAELA